MAILIYNTLPISDSKLTEAIVGLNKDFTYLERDCAPDRGDTVIVLDPVGVFEKGPAITAWRKSGNVTVVHITQNRDLEDPEDIYDYFLIWMKTLEAESILRTIQPWINEALPGVTKQ